ncbi:putative transcription factor C2H2 family [Arabidopsis thaliana]
METKESVNADLDVYKVVSCNCAPSTTDLVDKETEEDEIETCAICLEDMLESGFDAKQIYRMYNCWHMFHEGCVMERLNRQKNSCPLSRQPVYQ